jgi:hypothetical protein
LRRDDELGQLTAENLLLREPERPLGGHVELEHTPEVVDRDDRVERRVEDRSGVCLTGADARCTVRPRTAVSVHCLLTIVAIPAVADPRSG